MIEEDLDSEEALAELRSEIDSVKQYFRSEREEAWARYEKESGETDEDEDEDVGMEGEGEEALVPEGEKDSEEAAPASRPLVL